MSDGSDVLGAHDWYPTNVGDEIAIWACEESIDAIIKDAISKGYRDVKIRDVLFNIQLTMTPPEGKAVD